jgi:transcriptional regulator with XRE-family HTH domain
MKLTFGQALRQLRQKAGVTQRDLANRIGVDFSYISKLENDRMPPPAADTIVTICRELKESPEQLLALVGKIPTDVEEAVATNASGQEFLREVQTMKLTDSEWKEIRLALSHLREDNK